MLLLMVVHKSDTSGGWYWIPLFTGFFYIPGGSGFLNHQQYVRLSGASGKLVVSFTQVGQTTQLQMNTLSFAPVAMPGNLAFEQVFKRSSTCLISP